jgi:hypothetical protein
VSPEPSQAPLPTHRAQCPLYPSAPPSLAPTLPCPPLTPPQSFLTLLLSLPALALRDPKLKGGELGANPKYTMIFMLLGVVAIPMWVPHVGMTVVTFTLVLPSESRALVPGHGAGRRLPWWCPLRG